MDVLPNTIYASEAFLPISVSIKDLPGNYVPFLDVTDARLTNAPPRLPSLLEETAASRSAAAGGVRCSVNLGGGLLKVQSETLMGIT